MDGAERADGGQNEGKTFHCMHLKLLNFFNYVIISPIQNFNLKKRKLI